MRRFVSVLALIALVSACTSERMPNLTERPGARLALEPVPLEVRTDSFTVQVDSLRYTVAVEYPQITGRTSEVSEQVVRAVNDAVLDSVVALAERFRPTEAVPPDAPAYEVVTVEGFTDDVFLGADVFSAYVETYVYLGGAHGSSVAVPLNRDLRAGAAIRLGDLFRPGTPWPDTLSAQAERGLVRKAIGSGLAASLADMPGLLYPEGYDREVMRDARFTLGADSLAIHFVHYEVSAYAFGTSRVTVAYAALAPLMRTDGVAARLGSRR